MGESIKPSESEVSAISRRSFLKSAGKVAAVAGVGLVVGSIPDQYEPKPAINAVLSNWVNERTLASPRNARLPVNIIRENPLTSTVGKEREARRQVAETLEMDINRPLGANSTEIVKKTVPKLAGLQAAVSVGLTEDTGLRIVVPDTVTGELQTKEVVMRASPLGGYVYNTKEIGQDQRLISEAIINPTSGEAELTLDFTGERFEDANPNIHSNRNFPRTTLIVLDLLSGAIANSNPQKFKPVN